MNNIEHIVGIYKQRSYVDQTTKNRRLDVRDNQSIEKRGAISKVDTVRISDISRNMQVAMESAKSIPDDADWAEKVEQIKQEIMEGKYEIDARQIAHKMIGYFISDFA